MDNQTFIQKLTACRVIADDLWADAYDLSDKDIRWESILHAERILDEIDCFLNFLKSNGAENES